MRKNDLYKDRVETFNLKVEIFGNSGLKIHALNFNVALRGKYWLIIQPPE